jgi:hypothetical protein
MRERGAETQGRSGSAAADPQRQLPDPGQPVIAPRCRKMQVIAHAGVLVLV